MPSKSTKQQGLMGQAYAIRKFQRTHGKEGLDPKDIPAEYRDDIKKVSKQMKLKSPLEWINLQPYGKLPLVIRVQCIELLQLGFQASFLHQQ